MVFHFRELVVQDVQITYDGTWDKLQVRTAPSHPMEQIPCDSYSYGQAEKSLTSQNQ